MARKNVPLCDLLWLSWCETPLFAQGDGIPVGRVPVDTSPQPDVKPFVHRCFLLLLLQDYGHSDELPPEAFSPSR